MNDGRHIIWSNDLDYDDWKDDLEEQYPELSANERMDLMYEINGTYFQDEKTNLDIQLSRRILVIGDLGLWNGRPVWDIRKLKAVISVTACIRTRTMQLGL